MGAGADAPCERPWETLSKQFTPDIDPMPDRSWPTLSQHFVVAEPIREYEGVQ